MEHDRRGAWVSNNEVRDLWMSFTRSFKSSGGDVITDVLWRSEQNFPISIALIFRTDFAFRVCFGLVTFKFIRIKLWSVIVSETCTDLSIWSSDRVMTKSNVCRPVCVGSFTSCFRPKVSIRSANSMRSGLSGLSQWILKSPRMRRWPGRVDLVIVIVVVSSP